MNYIKEINTFYNKMEQNPLTGSAIALWYALMHINNKTRWKNEFTVAGPVLRMKAGLPETTFKRARKELKEKGFIDFESGSLNQAPVYRLMPAVDESVDYQVAPFVDHQADQLMDHQADQLMDHDADQNVDQNMDSLIKHKQKENEKNINKTKTIVINDSGAFSFYQNNFGPVSPFVTESLKGWVEDLGDDLVIEAMKRALERNKTNWGYVKSILQTWEKKGIRTIEDVKADEVAFRNKQNNKRNPGPLSKSKEIVPGWFEEQKRKEREERSKVQVHPEVSIDMAKEIEELRRDIERANVNKRLS